jgi:hypothetical protein
MPDDDLIRRLHDIVRWLSRASSTQEDATAVIEAIDLIERLRAREAEAAAIIAEAVVNHDAMEAEIKRLAAERDAKMSRPAELFMDVLKSAQGVDHPILDVIAKALEDLQGTWTVERKSEGLEFVEPSTPGQRFEIVVQPIDGKDEG